MAEVFEQCGGSDNTLATAALELYEFPSGHIGRRKYVHVEGHRRSVPVIYTYVGTDRRNHLRPEYGGNWDHAAHGRAPFIMSDIQAFVSPIDGAVISSRSHLREHEVTHDVIQVGNERIGAREVPLPPAHSDIVEAIHKVEAGYRPADAVQIEGME